MVASSCVGMMGWIKCKPEMRLSLLQYKKNLWEWNQQREKEPRYRVKITLKHPSWKKEDPSWAIQLNEPGNSFFFFFCLPSLGRIRSLVTERADWYQYLWVFYLQWLALVEAESESPRKLQLSLGIPMNLIDVRKLLLLPRCLSSELNIGMSTMSFFFF